MTQTPYFLPTNSATHPRWTWLPILGTGYHCHNPLFREARRYILLEIGTVILGLITLPLMGSWSYWAITGLLWWLLIMTALDIDHLIAPNGLTLPLILFGLVFNWSIHHNLAASALGACTGYSLLWLPMQSYRILHRRPGLGRGDCKCLAAMGAWLGWQVLPLILLIASSTALIASYGLYCHRVCPKTRANYTPFVPYLGLASAVIIASTLYFNHPMSLFFNARAQGQLY